MANPRKLDWMLLKRVGRYLTGAPRLVQTMKWQAGPLGLSTYVDSDWAGDKKTCKSTSGGMVFRGDHLIKSWSTSQQVVALSSGEAELYAQIKGAAQTLGVVSLGQDFGEMLSGVVYSDSSAALGIATRQGLGKLRHIRVQYLWLQERVAEGDLKVRKVPGETNPSDLLTQGLAQELHRRHSSFAGCEVRHTEDRQEATSAGAQDQALDLGLLVRQLRYLESLVEKQRKPEGQLGASEAGGASFLGGLCLQRGKTSSNSNSNNNKQDQTQLKERDRESKDREGAKHRGVRGIRLITSDERHFEHSSLKGPERQNAAPGPLATNATESELLDDPVGIEAHETGVPEGASRSSYSSSSLSLTTSSTTSSHSSRAAARTPSSATTTTTKRKKQRRHRADSKSESEEATGSGHKFWGRGDADLQLSRGRAAPRQVFKRHASPGTRGGGRVLARLPRGGVKTPVLCKAFRRHRNLIRVYSNSWICCRNSFVKSMSIFSSTCLDERICLSASDSSFIFQICVRVAR